MVTLPSETVARCSELLSRLREAYSPAEKLDHFLGVVRAVLKSVSFETFVTPKAMCLEVCMMLVNLSQKIYQAIDALRP